eukprot:scaffold45401_cov53-Attheya_sp.AAC.4
MATEEVTNDAIQEVQEVPEQVQKMIDDPSNIITEKLSGDQYDQKESTITSTSLTSDESSMFSSEGVGLEDDLSQGEDVDDILENEGSDDEEEEEEDDMSIASDTTQNLLSIAKERVHQQQLDERLHEMVELNADLEKQLKQSKSEMQHAVANKCDMENRLFELEVKLTDCKRLNNDLQAKAANVTQVQAQHEAQLMNEISDLVSRYDELDAKFTKGIQERDDVISERDEQIKSLKDLVRNTVEESELSPMRSYFNIQEESEKTVSDAKAEEEMLLSNLGSLHTDDTEPVVHATLQDGADNVHEL